MSNLPPNFTLTTKMLVLLDALMEATGTHSHEIAVATAIKATEGVVDNEPHRRRVVFESLKGHFTNLIGVSSRDEGGYDLYFPVTGRNIHASGRAEFTASGMIWYDVEGVSGLVSVDIMI